MPILFAFSPWADIGMDEPAYKLARLMDKCMWYDHDNGGLGIPVSWAMSGQTMKAIVKTDPSIKGTIRYRTANKSVYSSWDQSEIVGSTYHASGLAHPCLNDKYQEAYIDGFVKEDIKETNHTMWDLFERSPRGFCPSEKLFRGEAFGSDAHGQHNKGQVFQLENGLKVIPTVNEIMPSDFDRYHKAEILIDAIIEYCRRNHIGRVLLSADVDFWLDDNGFDRIKWMYLKAMERSNEIRMVNASALVESSWSIGYAGLKSLDNFYQSIGLTNVQQHISTWTNAAGNLEFIDWGRSGRSAEFIKAHTDKYERGINHQQWVDGAKLQLSKNVYQNICGTVFYDNRPQWENFMQDCFDNNLSNAWNILNDA
ncbi:hypothetical protein DFA_01651 [Cavenderia fasciculata]|uniref:Glycoside hydrolase family 57 N-terminal domain-containing protein n=1 Tax=Cavenderia fasciculata TaxID=261658 RepID=F4PTZ7_CACFS|nr:uncharacterized protein DFA_01651 [Cavenderia fasciculata]EGG21765.1 hypothetical protein DFA_01651 [Cavenderia fasciculata]|eukprot:XP_004359615.1 hypothetical protein DFA_01651 [Cavenderia fasciculata]